MAESTKLITFTQKLNPRILEDWKKTINRVETIRSRLEESLSDNTKKHRGGDHE